MFISLSSVLLLLIILNNFETIYSKRFRKNLSNYCNPTKEDSINVHIISHTHLDAGWVKSFSAYYDQSVKSILSSVIASLTDRNGLESRKFSFVEISFFDRYWNDITEQERRIIKKLVTDGKLQFISGGWVMNDEATPHYSMIIDQMSLGHHWLNRTFGPQVLPTTGWQIDPFGHSREYASILSQMGFNGLFLGRIDYQDRQKRESNKNMEFFWKTDPNLKSNNYLFTGITPTGYYPINGFCYDRYCSDLEFDESNHKYLSQRFIDAVKSQAKNYPTNHLMATMGGDFQYSFAEKWFQNLDFMINSVNAMQKNVHLLYSTPNCYLESLLNSDKRWTYIENDDFFPYADLKDAYWTGYFSSRPTFKYYVNYANNILQICKQLIVLSDIYPLVEQSIQTMQQLVAITAHHDSISGTSKQFVVEDYKNMLYNAILESQNIISIAYQKLQNPTLVPQFCHQLNISQCFITENLSDEDILQITIYNPLAQDLSYYLSLPISEPQFQIIDSNGQLVNSQIIPIRESIQSLSERNSTAKYEIYFEAKLRPLSFVNYLMQKVLVNQKLSYNSKNLHPETSDDIVISNNRLAVIIDKTTGLMKNINIYGQKVEITQNFYYYSSIDVRPSGAYSMHTNSSSPTIISSNASVSVIRGELVQEVVQEFNPWLSQVIRLYSDTDFIEFDWIVGPLPESQDLEVITRFETNFKTDNTFYTDSNGRQTLERIRDFRKSWNLSTKEKVSSNYYPINGWIFIRDLSSDLQLTVLPDRPQGGSSLEEGSVELMIHRRLSRDDGYGMEEALNELGFDGKGLVVRGKHILMLSRDRNSLRQVRKMSQLLQRKPLPFFTTDSKPNVPNSGIGLSHAIDDYIHILTLEELSENNVLLRLEYIYQFEETETKYVLLNKLFNNLKVIDVIETSLTGIETIPEVELKRFNWNCVQCKQLSETKVHQNIRDNHNNKFNISLYSNQIRTFLLKVHRIK